jgi:NAD-dependent deacetylase
MSLDDALTEAARRLRAAQRVAVLTGAGMSAESGVPTFRGPGGLWRNYRPADLASPEAFLRDPALVWEWYRWRQARVRQAAPNPGHLMLARFETRHPDLVVITQNVDGLHQRAGSTRVVEMHGNIWRARCAAGCGHTTLASHLADQGPPPAPVPLCACGAPMRPDIVWFGESLDARVLDEAFDAASRCDVLISIGTSSVVYPAAALPGVARQHRAALIEINVDDTPLTGLADLVLRGPSGQVLPAIETRL